MTHGDSAATLMATIDEQIHEIAELKRQISQYQQMLKQDAWMPISTVPAKTDVLLCWADDYGNIEQGRYFPDNRSDVRWHNSNSGNFTQWPTPTHWRPLPKPPSE